ncbi:MAG: magnesium transporter [Dehalococcoidia bacterium]
MLEQRPEENQPQEAEFEDRQVPDAVQLEQVQERIVGQLETGDPETAASELQELRPPDRAEVLADLQSEQRRLLLNSLSEDAIAEALEHMEVAPAVELSRLLDVERMAAVLDRVSPDVAADVLRGIDWDDAGQILGHMQDRRAIGNLLLYQDDDAGGLMSTSVVALRDTWPAPHAINVLRNSGLDPEDLRHLFVVDGSGVLVGHLELPELVFASPGAIVRDVMRPDVIAVETGTDQEEAARLMARYEIRSLPVVNAQGRLEGAIAIEDLVDVVEQEATEDMYKMTGVRGEDRADGPVALSVRNRLPWLMVNIGAVSVVALVLSFFEPTLDQLAILAVYMPMVMNQAGIAGNQVAIVIVRSLALGQVNTSDTGRLLGRETTLAIVNGGIISLVLGAIVGLWRQDEILGLVVFSAMLFSYFVASTAGVMIPMTMKKFRIDPATASGVVLTTCTDIAGGASYLGLATVLLALLETN